MFILKINGEPVESGHIVSIACDESMQLNNTDTGVTFGLSDTRSYSEWYAEFIHSKQQAMLHSGVSDNYTSEKGGNASYYFKEGFTASFVRSINNTIPDSNRNITLLGSRVVDVSAYEKKPNVLLVSRLSVGGNMIQQLREIYLFTMRLYDAFNHISTRLLEFSPGTWNSEEHKVNNNLGKIRGSLLNYQANVARWNYLVWRSSYTQDIVCSRQNIALSLGYSCVACKVDGVIITTVIKKDSSPGSGVEGLDSAYCLTIYRQSVSDDRQNTAQKVETTMTKDKETIFGFGQDKEYKNWNEIKIVQVLPAMVQSDKYAELFALAPGVGVTEYLHLSTDIDPNESQNTFIITTTWEVQVGQNQTLTMTKEEKVKVAAIKAQLMVEVEEEEEA